MESVKDKLQVFAELPNVYNIQSVVDTMHVILEFLAYT